MWLKKKNPSKETDAPEKLRHSRYYEHDGILRAYANRAMMLAFLCIPTTMLALAFAVYVRLQPSTVIRVDENGLATAACSWPTSPRAAARRSRRRFCSEPPGGWWRPAPRPRGRAAWGEGRRHRRT